MKNKIISISALTFVLLTSACAEKFADGTSTSGISKANGGAILGGIAGGVAGNQFGSGAGKNIATVGGVALGALAGHAIGNSMDKPVDIEQYSYNNARPANYNILQDTLEHGRSNQTSEPGMFAGQVVSITPTQTFVNNYNQNCRSYNMMDSSGRISSGSACRQADGYWR